MLEAQPLLLYYSLVFRESYFLLHNNSMCFAIVLSSSLPAVPIY